MKLQQQPQGLRMKNLKELREFKKLTQTDVALYCGVSLNAYRNWEIGTSKPNADNLKKLEKLLME